MACAATAQLVKFPCSTCVQAKQCCTAIDQTLVQDAVKALLAAPGIKVKAKAVDDMTALHFAAQNGHTEAARMLITAGLPVNSKTRKQVTPLHIACQKGVAPGLPDCSGPRTARPRYFRSCRVHLRPRVAPNGTSRTVVLCTGQTSVVELLLQRKAGIYLEDKRGENALAKCVDDATRSGFVQCHSRCALSCLETGAISQL